MAAIHVTPLPSFLRAVRVGSACIRLSLSAAIVVLFFASQTPSALGVVKFFDGFGDGDRNNDGVLNEADTDTGTNGIGTYIPARASNSGMATNNEVSTVLDAGDTGLRWLSHSGFTDNNTGDRRAFIAIVDDTQGAMLETQPTTTPGGLGITAIDDGYALSYNSKGRGNSAAAFFDERIELGPEVGDQVKVSFDFRPWRDAPNANSFEQPDDGELRFGLFQDTDNQLGMSNPVAGPDVDLDMNGTFETRTSAVFGQDDGYFDGTRTNIPVGGSDIGSPGDAGWYGLVILENPVGQFPPLVPNGGGWRIREETNIGAGANDRRILQGALPETDTVATPQEANPGTGDFGLVNLDVRKVYNLSLTLERYTNITEGDTILAHLTATDLATGTSYTLSDYEPITNMGNPDGISSDSWDYFAIRNTGIDDFDLMIDNFKLEIFGSNAGVPGDFDGDGDVDGRDFLAWQRNPGVGNLSDWQDHYGMGPLSSFGAVPEPSAWLLASLGLSGMFSLRRR